MPRLNSLRISTTFALAVASVALPGAARAVDPSAEIPIHLAIDQAQILRLDTAAATVVVGNPSIADAAIRDGNTVFLLGRNFGVTNLIFLDANGKEVVNLRATVGRLSSSTVTLNRGAGQYTYSCLPGCERVLFITDADFKDLSSNASTKVEMGVSAAEKGSAGQE